MKILASLALMLATVSSPSAQPRLVLDAPHWGVLTGLPPVLQNEEIRRQLRSGLTTSMVFTVGSPSRSSSRFGGAGRVEIRYEPWDEIFLVRTIGIDGAVADTKLSTQETLELWWSELQLRVMNLEHISGPLRDSVTLTLKVVPFSHAEQHDTQRWYSESVHQSGRSTDDVPGVRPVGPDPLEKMLSALIATSIQRRPLISFEWKLDWPAEESSP